MSVDSSVTIFIPRLHKILISLISKNIKLQGLFAIIYTQYGFCEKVIHPQKAHNQAIHCQVNVDNKKCLMSIMFNAWLTAQLKSSFRKNCNNYFIPFQTQTKSDTNRDFVKSWRYIDRQSQIFIWTLWWNRNSCQHRFRANDADC